ncbi:MAG: hypothetical protein CVU84_11985 [Firmicutes bacterium HGW-Firmicutes-1]|nr:MAG: hypothetical protein CVU84_11985 [Firmicutes bacterium HGW-Firmicutes-1]
MKMKQDKNERLVLRVTPGLKQSIEELAQKQNMSVSELIRKVLEDVVCKKQKEIEQCVLMINTIAEHINHLLEQMVFVGNPKDISRITKEVRDYRKISYSHQSKAIEIIMEEKALKDTKIQSLKSILDNDSKILSDYLEKSGDDLKSLKDYGIIQDRTDILEEQLWNSTYKLYKYLCGKYFTTQNL